MSHYFHKRQFDHLVYPIQDILWSKINKTQEIFDRIKQKILKAFGNKSLNTNEDRSAHDNYYPHVVRILSCEQKINNISQKESQHSITERNTRINIYHIMNGHIVWLKNHIQKEQENNYDKKLSDKLIYYILFLLKDRLSFDEESTFWENFQSYNSYIDYLKQTVDKKSWFYDEFIEYCIEYSDNDNLKDKTYNELREHIKEYILRIIIPEINIHIERLIFLRNSFIINIKKTTEIINTTWHQIYSELSN